MKSDLHRMSKAGKTFFFSSLWLKKGTRLDVAKAYNFCRVVDDLADKFSDEDARNESLIGILAAINNNDLQHQIAAPILSLIIKFPEIKAPILKLVTACLNDKPGMIISNESELIEYASGVAGTVGLVMYALLGGTNPKGRTHAEALGIAMQFTNITRDVAEDLNDGRIYLPQEWLGETNYQKILVDDFEKNAVSAVRQVLKLADRYYEMGLAGLGYLNPESRKAVEIAARCYSEIGRHVIKDDKILRRRAVVGIARKLTLVLNIYFLKKSPLLKAIIF